MVGKGGGSEEEGVHQIYTYIGYPTIIICIYLAATRDKWKHTHLLTYSLTPACSYSAIRSNSLAQPSINGLSVLVNLQFTLSANIPLLTPSLNRSPSILISSQFTPSLHTHTLIPSLTSRLLTYSLTHPINHGLFILCFYTKSQFSLVSTTYLLNIVGFFILA